MSLSELFALRATFHRALFPGVKAHHGGVPIQGPARFGAAGVGSHAQISLLDALVGKQVSPAARHHRLAYLEHIAEIRD